MRPMGLNKVALELCGRVQTNRARWPGCAKPVNCVKIKNEERRPMRMIGPHVKEKHFVSCQK
jgi:hypothetical protein